MWIFRSWRWDFAWLVLPGLLGCLLSQLIQGGSPALYGYYLFTYAFVDGGHIWITHLRTYANRDELASSRRYFWVPLLILAVFIAWYYFRVPYIWSFIFYNTVFHHIRQYHGINRWYQKLNERTDRISNYFLHALLILPFVLFHFRDDVRVKYFSSNDMFIYPSPAIFSGVFQLYIAVISAWMIYEVYLWLKGIRETGRFLAIFTPAALSGFCFLGGKSGIEVVFPMTLAHGIAYMGLVGLSLDRTQQQRYSTWWKIALSIVGVCLVLGSYHLWLEDRVIDFDFPYTHIEPTFVMALAVGLHATAVICHYIFDAYLWNGRHREAKLVFKR